jgi:hypothetical protein
MFSVIILMCDFNRTTCWTYTNPTMFETKPICEQVADDIIKSNDMGVMEELGWIVTGKRCVNWKEEMA